MGIQGTSNSYGSEGKLEWQGKVLSINDTCDKLGDKFLQLLGMHHLTNSNTTLHLYGKGKSTALKIIVNDNFEELETVLGETGASDSD